MSKLDDLKAELVAEHEALTQAFEAQQQTAEAEWAKLDQAKAELTAWRKANGHALKALVKGAVKVEN